MKITAAKAERFCKSPDPAISVVLVYGPDRGLVGERLNHLTRSVVDDPSDPFRVSQLRGADLVEDPARLADEAAAFSFTGGRRVVRVSEAADTIAKTLGSLIEAPRGNALVLVEAGDLPARSALRKLFEASDAAAAVPCYPDDARGLQALIRDTLGAERIAIEPAAVGELVSRLASDRLLVRRELEKLILYHGASGQAISVEDVRSCIGNSSEATLENLALAFAEGDIAAMERLFDRSLQDGTSPIAILRSAGRHLQRLHLAAGLMKDGRTVEQALSALRPPVFWKTADRFKRQVRRLDLPVLAGAMTHLMATEAACKRTGAPAELLARSALVDMARRWRESGERP